MTLGAAPSLRSFGCGRCGGDDAAIAWTASQAERIASYVQESHFGVHVSRCRCGQHFVTVFTERIDWQGGEDDQTWLVLPVSAEELPRIEAEPHRSLPVLGADRRFLVRSFPTGGSVSCWWRQGGFAIGPHD